MLTYITFIGNYNSYNTLNNLENFLKNIGDNSEGEILTLKNIINNILNIILQAYNTDSFWISLRIQSKTSFFDIPRWHCDG